MRTNWRMRVSYDQRGKITTGAKVLSKTGVEIPKSLDHFNIQSFPEIINSYGEKPDKLFILFPSDDIDSFFQTEFALWGTSKQGNPTKKRTCDGEICYHHIQESINDKQYSAGEETPCFKCYDGDCEIEKDHRCHCFTGFSAYILSPQTGKIILARPYRFQTNSANSGDRILSELNKVFMMCGGLARIPFILSVQMIETTTPINGKAESRKYPLWDLQVYGTIEQMIEFRNRKLLPTTEESKLLISGDKQVEAVVKSEPEIKQSSIISKDEVEQFVKKIRDKQLTKGAVHQLLGRYGFRNEFEITTDKYDSIIAELSIMDN